MTPDEAEPSPRFTAGLMKMSPAKKPAAHQQRTERRVVSDQHSVRWGLIQWAKLGQDSPGLRACVRVTVMLTMVAPTPALFGCISSFCDRNGVSYIGTKTKKNVGWTIGTKSA